MSTHAYARIQSGVVAELLTTADEISEMFVPSLTWIDLSATPEVAEGWTYDGAQFAAPVVSTTLSANPPGLAELQSQIAALSAQIAASAKTG
jgi:phage tail protein X